MTTPVDAPHAWQVETPRPADRGLVVRLLEQVVAADGDVAMGTEEVQHWSRQVLDVLRHDESAMDARRPIYIDYLLEHEE